MDGVIVPVAVVASRTEAELIVGLLRSHGLSAAVSADDAGGQDPQLQLQGVRVLVAPGDESSARRLLADASLGLGIAVPEGCVPDPVNVVCQRVPRTAAGTAEDGIPRGPTRAQTRALTRRLHWRDGSAEVTR